jgi:hypothetical protein
MRQLARATRKADAFTIGGIFGGMLQMKIQKTQFLCGLQLDFRTPPAAPTFWVSGKSLCSRWIEADVTAGLQVSLLALVCRNRQKVNWYG